MNVQIESFNTCYSITIFLNILVGLSFFYWVYLGNSFVSALALASSNRSNGSEKPITMFFGCHRQNFRLWWLVTFRRVPSADNVTFNGSMAMICTHFLEEFATTKTLYKKLNLKSWFVFVNEPISTWTNVVYEWSVSTVWFALTV